MSAKTTAPSVLVIGAGLYVCGRGTPGLGTVLPTLAQAQAEGMIGQIVVAATSAESLRVLREKLAQINGRLGTHVEVHGYPRRGQDPNAYRSALKDLPRPGCVIVAVPDHLHAPVAAEVVEAGLHVLVVKPLAPTAAAAERLAALAQSRGVYGAVEFHKRWDEANLLLRQTIADGRLGQLRHVSVEYGQRREIQEAFNAWIDQTNIFQYLGVHYVDLIYFLTNAQPVRVLAVGEPRAAGRGEAPRRDAIQALIEWKVGQGEGFTSSILTNWIEPAGASAMSDQRIRVLGTRGRYDSDQKHRGVQLVTDDGVEDANPYFSQVYRSATGQAVIEGYGPRSIRQFLSDVNHLIHGRVALDVLNATRPSFRDAIASTAVLEAVNESLMRGGLWVSVDASLFARSDARARPVERRRRPRVAAMAKR